ncbi:MAG: hypothetical protein JO011_07025 [Ktedonobacteraceae bacterium]|nr:hypothetical protein [Ktedonobacteraceae bacterium]
MQDYQISQFAAEVDCPDFLISPRDMSSTRSHKRTGLAVDGPAVPVSPGRAIRLHPYPPSQRRRQ